MKTAAEHWTSSGKAKADELSRLAEDLITHISMPDHNQNREKDLEARFKTVSEKADAFSDHFGPQQAPSNLTQFREALHTWWANRGHAPTFRKLVGLSHQLRQLSDYDPQTPAFHSILEGYRQDEELEGLLTELVTKLRELVKVADSELSAQIARELGQVLEELEHRNNKNLTDLMAWIDLGAKGLVEILAARKGFSHGTLAYECAKLAIKSKVRLLAVWDKAEDEFRLKLGFTFLNKAAKQFPELKNEADLDRYLPAPDEAKP